MDASEVLRFEQKVNPVADVLRRARALVDMPEKWVRYSSLDGEKLCMWGALLAAGDTGQYCGELTPAEEALSSAVGDPHNIGAIYLFNDAPDRTHPEVLAAFDRAIALAESQ